MVYVTPIVVVNLGDENIVFNYLSQFHELPRMCITENIQYRGNNFDHKFGVYHEIEREKFSKRDSHISFDGTSYDH